MTRDQIIATYRQRLKKALQGADSIDDVCGLGIEALRNTIIAERDQLLRKHGHSVPGDGKRHVSS